MEFNTDNKNINTKKELAKKYQKKSDKQHVLDNPDTYIGSVEKVDTTSYIYDNEKESIVEKNIHWIPGLYKLFDEGIVNCRDHVVRMQQKKNEGENVNVVSFIDIAVSDDGTITMVNDGNGIDIEKHPEHDIWIPEMIFGHLRTSTNYDKTEKKIVGGKNGFGFKLALIWSTYGKIETIDHTRKLKYVQEFKDNLNIIEKPVITKCSNKPLTKISFKPDYARLGLDGLSNDFVALFKRRVYDIAAVTSKSIKVKWNSGQISVQNFQQYINLYVKNYEEQTIVYENQGERWEYAICLSPNDEFQQVSFVNGIFTSKGGKHVDYILNQVVKKIVTYIKTKKKIDVKPASIKEQLMLFIRCDIESPAFDSQTKDYMNTPMSSFGSSCVVSDKFIEKVAKMGVMKTACAITEVRETKAVKKTDGTKTKTIRGIPKLLDANYAGTTKSKECTIIFCEGDSAKAGIVSGLSKDDRNYIGVYPLKGKLFNVRGETAKKIADNKEINEIKQIIGLAVGKTYTKEEVSKNLRYGKIMFMTDQDLDGTHIKALGINLFQAEWCELSKIPGFIGFMNTPILKARKGKQEKVFYNEGEYNTWKEENETKGWNIKYYKGLGTSTGKEFKEYFEKKKVVEFISGTDEDDDSIDMVFNKKRADDRKDWLGNYNRNSFLDTNDETVSYKDFINKELIHFSKYDCDRSIPNLMDGLKISLRKILFSAFKRKLNNEIKVAQFSGYVSEHSGYHHGEASLNQAIVGLAQNFVGSNNINLFLPNGQFGTRLLGGKDSASERYIFTALNPITRYIYREEDDNILTYLDDDGTPVEPIYYAPIIPMVLVNGSKGIGTGFSTDIISYNPKDIIERLKSILVNGNDNEIKIRPYFEGFKGSVEWIDEKYVISGVYEHINDTQIRITELPIGTWTEDYKVFLEGLIDPKESSSTTNKDKDKKKSKATQPVIKSYTDMSTDTKVDITLTFVSNTAIHHLENEEVQYGKNGLEKYLKLYTTHTPSNMHLFDSDERLTKYDTPEQIMDVFIDKRLELYEKRKEYQIKHMENELKIMSNKAKFIQYNLCDKIDLRRKTKDEMNKIMTEYEFDMVQESYNYLVKMPMDSVTKEKADDIMKERDNKQNELNILKNKTIKQIWLEELEMLLIEYDKFLININEINNEEENKSNKGSSSSSKIKIKKRVIKSK